MFWWRLLECGDCRSANQRAVAFRCLINQRHGCLQMAPRDYCVLLAQKYAGESGNNAVLQYRRMIVVARRSYGEPFGRLKIASAVILLIYTIDQFEAPLSFYKGISYCRWLILKCPSAQVRLTSMTTGLPLAPKQLLFSAKQFSDALHRSRFLNHMAISGRQLWLSLGQFVENELGQHKFRIRWLLCRAALACVVD